MITDFVLTTLYYVAVQLIRRARLSHRLEVYFLEDRGLFQWLFLGVEFGSHLSWAGKILRVKIYVTFLDDF